MVTPFESSLVPALVLVAPGFLVLLLLRQSRGRRVWGGVYEKTLTSLMLSGVIDALYLGVNRLHSADELVGFVFSRPLLTVLEIVVFSFGAAILLAAYLVYDPLGRSFRRFFYGKELVVPDDKKLWDKFMLDNQLRPAMISCRDGAAYVGFLQGYSLDDEPMAVRLSRVKRVAYDQDGKALEAPEGTEILLQGDDVVRVTILSVNRGQTS